MRRCGTASVDLICATALVFGTIFGAIFVVAVPHFREARLKVAVTARLPFPPPLHHRRRLSLSPSPSLSHRRTLTRTLTRPQSFLRIHPSIQSSSLTSLTLKRCVAGAQSQLQSSHAHLLKVCRDHREHTSKEWSSHADHHPECFYAL